MENIMLLELLKQMQLFLSIGYAMLGFCTMYALYKILTK